MDPKDLLPGDVLLYHRKGFFNWVIYHASNSKVSHSETFIGDGKTVASRNGIGVGTYTFFPDGLCMVLRPKATFDVKAALAWHATVMGQKYDWLGLFRSFVENKWGKQNNKMWCSEHTTNFQRAGSIEPFPVDVPADSIAPGDFPQSLAYSRIWVSQECKEDVEDIS